MSRENEKSPKSFKMCTSDKICLNSKYYNIWNWDDMSVVSSKVTEKNNIRLLYIKFFII